MIPSRQLVLTVSAAAVAVLGLTPAGAAAAPQPPGEALVHDGAPSADLAGYSGPGGDRGIAATFTVPRFTCAPFENSAIFPSLTSYYEPGADRLQNGGGGVVAVCEEGVRSYTPVLMGPEYEWIEVDRRVQPGDKIRVTFTSSRPTNSSRIENLTKGWSATDDSPYYPTVAGEVGDARFGLESPPAFARNSFTRVKVDGQKLTRDRWVEFDLVDDFGDTVLDTSAVRRGGFKVEHV